MQPYSGTDRARRCCPIAHIHLYYALGSLSRLFYERSARTLAEMLPQLEVEVYEGRSHMDPPHRAEPERFARALWALWRQAETATTAAA